LNWWWLNSYHVVKKRMSRDRNEKYHVRQSSAPCASIPFGVASIVSNEKWQNMDPDFQLKVHFNAGGFQRVQKRFLNRCSYKSKVNDHFAKEDSDRQVSQHESHDNYFRPCDQYLLKPRDKNWAAANSNSQRPFHHSSDFDSMRCKQKKMFVVGSKLYLLFYYFSWQPLQAKELVKLNFHKNAEGKGDEEQISCTVCIATISLSMFLN